MVYLSLWQFNRLDERKAFNREVTERSSQSVVDVSTLDVSDPAVLNNLIAQLTNKVNEVG